MIYLLLPVTEEDLNLLCDIVGSLAIDQFDNQEEYRAVINEIFYEWRIKCSKNYGKELKPNNGQAQSLHARSKSWRRTRSRYRNRKADQWLTDQA